MKMGTIVSPWHYDALASHLLQRVDMRLATILRYASWVAVFPISPVVRNRRGGPQPEVAIAARMSVGLVSDLGF